MWMQLNCQIVVVLTLDPLCLSFCRQHVIHCRSLWFCMRLLVTWQRHLLSLCCQLFQSWTGFCLHANRHAILVLNFPLSAHKLATWLLHCGHVPFTVFFILSFCHCFCCQTLNCLKATLWWGLCFLRIVCCCHFRQRNLLFSCVALCNKRSNWLSFLSNPQMICIRQFLFSTGIDNPSCCCFWSNDSFLHWELHWKQLPDCLQICSFAARVWHPSESQKNISNKPPSNSISVMTTSHWFIVKKIEDKHLVPSTNWLVGQPVG